MPTSPRSVANAGRMVQIPGGEFWMGSAEFHDASVDELVAGSLAFQATPSPAPLDDYRNWSAATDLPEDLTLARD